MSKTPPVRLLTLGDQLTGKSSLLQRFTKGEFDQAAQSTVAIDFHSINLEVNGSLVPVQVWDTAGQERFRSLTRSYFKGAMGIVVVFDMTKISSFRNVRHWLRDVRQYADREVQVVLVGNKSDLREDRQVAAEEARVFAEDQGIRYFETSAKSALNVHTAFQYLVKCVMATFMMRDSRHQFRCPTPDESICASTASELSSSGCDLSVSSSPDPSPPLLSHFPQQSDCPLAPNCSNCDKPPSRRMVQKILKNDFCFDPRPGTGDWIAKRIGLVSDSPNSLNGAKNARGLYLTLTYGIYFDEPASFPISFMHFHEGTIFYIGQAVSRVQCERQEAAAGTVPALLLRLSFQMTGKEPEESLGIIPY
eukprot:g26867.t1